MKSRLISAVTFVGSEVQNLEGHDLGEIVDLMLDEDTGNTAYAVIATGFLGLDDLYIAVPWKAFIINSKKERVQLDISKEDFKKAPSFERENWPAYPHEEFVTTVHHFFGFSPYWEQSDDT